jgi:hypothetical protein
MNMTGLTDAQKKDWQLMKEVAYFTKLNPEQRNTEVMNGWDILAPGLSSKGITLSSE